jgi:transcriptional regulator with XRE-family HTH domain
MDLWGDIMEKGIGKRIKEARLNLGLTQEELAEKIGVTKGAIANYEKKYEPSKRTCYVCSD